MGWLRKNFLYREDYNPALQGLRGLAVLWFFHLSFYGQFDPAKLTRITLGRPWLEKAVGALPTLLAPGFLAPAVMYLLAGYLASGGVEKSSFPGYLLARCGRVYPVYLAAVLPILAYTCSGFGGLASALALFELPQGLPDGSSAVFASLFWLPVLWAAVHGATKTCPNLALRSAIFLAAAGLYRLVHGEAAALAAFPWVLAGVTAGALSTRLAARHAAGPGTAAAARAARLLSHPVLRYFGAVALPFFLIHATWGLRLSRSILHGEFLSIQNIAAHYAMSLAFSTVFAGFLHRFFERPHLLRNLRNAPPADTKPRSVIQGARS